MRPSQIVLQFDKTRTGDLAATDRSHRYLWGTGVDQILADEQVHYDWTPEDYITDALLWPLGDHLGSLRDVVDKYGTVRIHRAYDAYGNITSQELRNSGNQPVQPGQPGALLELLGFTARPFDADTLLQNNLHRWYDATVGRWLSEDPIRYDAGDPNLYRYVLDKPTGLTDPMGELADFSLGADGWARPRDNVEHARDLLRQLKRWLDAIPCKCELSVGWIPHVLNALLLPNRPNGKPQWPWQHCTAHCMMVSMCGGGQEAARCAARIGLAEEVIDLVLRKLLGYQDACNSAFQQSDFRDNAAGRNFGRCCAAFGRVGAAACCAAACGGRWNAEEGNEPESERPFGPVGDPRGPWPGWGDIMHELW